MPSRTVCCDCEMLSTVPWGVVRSALHVGRREGDAVWHRRSDRRIPPCETVVKRLVITVITNVGSRPARNAGRHVRAKFASCAQTPSRSAGPARSGVGAKRRTLHGVEHSSTLTNVTAGQHAPGQKVAQILRVTRRRNLS